MCAEARRGAARGRYGGAPRRGGGGRRRGAASHPARGARARSNAAVSIVLENTVGTHVGSEHCAEGGVAGGTDSKEHVRSEVQWGGAGRVVEQGGENGEGG